MRRLAAQEDVVGVALGGILGHMICTGAAVIGGRHLAAHINERTVGVSGWNTASDRERLTKESWCALAQGSADGNAQAPQL